MLKGVNRVVKYMLTFPPVIMQKHAFWDWFWIFKVEFDDNLTYIKILYTELHFNRPRGILQHGK